MARLARWMQPETRTRRLLLGLGIYAGTILVFALLAGDRLMSHTAANHYALLADAWLHGRHHLGGSPPAYSGMNDFALFQGKWFISFPPFPAILMAPLVKLAGSPENFRDGQFVVWLAGLGPAVLFLALEKLRRNGSSQRSELENIRLSLLFAFGTVYFFTAVQGTVWFAAHVVGVALAALFVLFALDAEHPALAGLMVGFMFLTRPTTALSALFFLCEAIRVSSAPEAGHDDPERDLSARAVAAVRSVDLRAVGRTLAMFTVPIAACLGFAAWLNHARFETWNPSAFGHEYLQVGWKARIDRWGLFSVHFLPRNLAVMLASLPWRPLPSEQVPLEVLGMTFQLPRWVVGGHGVALWFTSPFYLWILRPKRVSLVWLAALAAAVGPLTMNLVYQNSGFSQFGYRFSNDYAVFLFVLLALGIGKLSRAFWLCAAWAVAINLFGARSFERADFAAFYAHEAAVPMRRYNGNATLDLVYPPD